MIKIKQLSSLAKVIDDRIYGNEIIKQKAFKGQEIAYQLSISADRGYYRLTVSSELSEYIRIYREGKVDCGMTAYPHSYDDDYLVTDSRKLLDPLFPYNGEPVYLSDETTVFWVSIDIPKYINAGEYEINATVADESGDSGSSSFLLEVGACAIKAQRLRFTQWFHCDCIADVHNVEVFSEEHWHLIEEYIRLAAENGMNMILVPVLTPPLDTEVGGERPTVQLVDISKNGEEYSFDFSRLKRYIEICKRCGIRYFEINHFFTQWGANATPKVIACIDGEKKRIFGWDVPSNSKEYGDFLNALLPEIIDLLVISGIERKNIYFHISDEPGDAHVENYKMAYNIISSLCEGCNIIDALSHFKFYEQGIVKKPVVAIDALEPFLEANIDERWCYYCCAQTKLVSNRFMAMPSYRNRIIGLLMYKYGISGFLHWGYNFYYTRFSKRKVSPFFETDAGGAFPSGDSFSVYPDLENKTAIASLRQKVFKNALEDIMVLELLEEKIGKSRVVELIDSLAGFDIDFKNYPRNEEYFSRLYDEIFKLI